MRTSPLRRAAVLALLAAGSLASGCGGGDDGATTLTIAASPDATIASDGTIVLAGATAITVGDTAANLGQRGALRFGILFLPTGATIVSAKLQLRQAAVNGAPFATLGAVVVDRVDFGLGVDGGDFNPPGAGTAVGTLSSDATLGLKEVDVTAAVAADLAANALTSDFLVRFSLAATDGDGVVDSVVFDDSENDLGTGTGPTLVVTYR